jgi:predicted aspartyl protease
MPLTFDYEKHYSPIFGQVYRPIAQVYFFSKTKSLWYEIWMIVDTGADYTLLPKHLSTRLGINLKKDCKIFQTLGIGGVEKVYLFKGVKAKIGHWERTIPVGFLDREDVPPLLGRQQIILFLFLLVEIDEKAKS